MRGRDPRTEAQEDEDGDDDDDDDGVPPQADRRRGVPTRLNAAAVARPRDWRRKRTWRRYRRNQSG